MAGQFAADAHIALARLETVDGANVVQTTACDVGTRRSIGARHHPARSQWNCVHLVGGVCIPYDQLAVLRGGNKISLIFK